MNRKEIVILTLVVFLTVIAWIAFGVYHAQSAATISEADFEKVAPLTPTFDTDLTEMLKKRED